MSGNNSNSQANNANTTIDTTVNNSNTGNSDYDSFINEWTSRIDNYLAGSPMAGQGYNFAVAAGTPVLTLAGLPPSPASRAARASIVPAPITPGAGAPAAAAGGALVAGARASLPTLPTWAPTMAPRLPRSRQKVLPAHVAGLVQQGCNPDEPHLRSTSKGPNWGPFSFTRRRYRRRQSRLQWQQ